MVYGEVISMYANTWYSPAPMNMKELKAKAMQRILRMYDTALLADDYYGVWFFNNELGCMSREAQREEMV